MKYLLILITEVAFAGDLIYNTNDDPSPEADILLVVTIMVDDPANELLDGIRGGACELMGRPCTWVKQQGGLNIAVDLGPGMPRVIEAKIHTEKQPTKLPISEYLPSPFVDCLLDCEGDKVCLEGCLPWGAP